LPSPKTFTSDWFGITHMIKLKQSKQATDTFIFELQAITLCICLLESDGISFEFKNYLSESLT